MTRMVDIAGTVERSSLLPITDAVGKKAHGKLTTVTQFQKAEQTTLEILFPHALNVIEAKETGEDLAN